MNELATVVVQSKISDTVKITMQAEKLWLATFSIFFFLLLFLGHKYEFYYVLS